VILSRDQRKLLKRISREQLLLVCLSLPEGKPVYHLEKNGQPEHFVPYYLVQGLVRLHILQPQYGEKTILRLTETGEALCRGNL